MSYLISKSTYLHLCEDFWTLQNKIELFVIYYIMDKDPAIQLFAYKIITIYGKYPSEKY